MSRIEQKDVERALLGLTNENVPTPHPIADRVIRALWEEVQAARRADPGQLRVSAQFVHDTFKKDLDQGYRTRDKQFAVDVLGMSLRESPAMELVPLAPGMLIHAWVIDSARMVELYFHERNIKSWALGGIQKRVD